MKRFLYAFLQGARILSIEQSHGQEALQVMRANLGWYTGVYKISIFNETEAKKIESKKSAKAVDETSAKATTAARCSPASMQEKSSNG